MGIKISELQEKATANDTDVLPIVDDGTKKITKSNFLKEITESLINLGTYSTEETDTGKTWIDGKKIYRKVVPVNFPTSSSTTAETAHNIINIEMITDYSLMWFDTDDHRWYKSFKDTTGEYWIIMDGVSSQNIRIKTSKPYAWQGRTSDRYATLEYTKTE